MRVNKVLIVSNSQPEQSEIKSQLLKLPFIINSKEAVSIHEAIEDVISYKPNIIIADLETINFSELKILVDTLPTKIPIIVISKNINDAVEGYNTGIPVDFILKPIYQERLQVAFCRALKSQTPASIIKEHEFIFLKIARAFKKFYLEDIVYVEAYGIYSKVHTMKGRFTINESIMKLEGRLPNDSFVRIHKSYVINTTKILTVKSNNLEMEIGEVPVGANYRPSVEGFLNMMKKIHSHI